MKEETKKLKNQNKQNVKCTNNLNLNNGMLLTLLGK